MKVKTVTIAALCGATMLTATCHADAKPTPSAPKKSLNLSTALDVTALKIEMAENNLRLRPNIDNMSELISSLEESANSTCLKDLPKNLKYSGKPTDPNCVAKMERLLELNPDNPVALCVRDGIGAESCINAYRNQRMEQYTSSSDNEKKLLDPSLKVGLSAQDLAQLDSLQGDLQKLDPVWAAAKTDEERQNIMESAAPTYDRMLAIACRVSVLKIQKLATNDPYETDSRFVEVRDKLGQIPVTMRGDYQAKMLSDLEEELAKAKGRPDDIKRITALMEVVRAPDGEGYVTSANSERVRFLLPKCVELMKMVTKNIPNFPSPVCHVEGWYSPQCIAAIRNWKMYLRKKQDAAASKAGKAGEPKPSISAQF